MKNNITTDAVQEAFDVRSLGQLELGFQRGCEPRPLIRRKPFKGARWWFNQMREAVNRAPVWATAPAARPEQTFLNLTSPEPRV